MTRHSRRRVRSPAASRDRHPGLLTGATEPLVSVLARPLGAMDLLTQLHRRAVEAAVADCSMLFEHNPRDGVLLPTSGYGLDELRLDPWMPDLAEAARVSSAITGGEPTLVPALERQMPDLAIRLSAHSALLLPLTQGDWQIGLLAVGYRTTRVAGTAPALDAAELAAAFVAALELLRFRRRDELQRDVRELLREFGARLSATLNLRASLEIFCDRANRLFGADRTSVWIHDRRARVLALQASSDAEHVSRGARVPADDPLAPPAAAMRHGHAELVPSLHGHATRLLTIPLRGTRRALGAIVFDGVRVEVGGEPDLLDRADELGRQLAGAVETLQLIDDVMRSRGELENTFNSIAHLVVVADRRGRIVHANDAFAARLGQKRDQLVDRPIADCIGPELARWLAARERAEEESAPPGNIQVVDPVLNGPFVVTATALLNRERERTGSVLVARDVTPESRLEAEREELRKRLIQSEKLAALGQFVAGIAHELNNPLQGVLGHLELLRVTGAFPRQLRREAQTIYREADRAARIVRNLLVFAGSRRLERRRVSLTAVLQKVIALRQQAARTLDIEVVRHYEPHLPRVEGDSLLLHQLFLNMMLNAEGAIAADGRAGRIEIGAARSRDHARIVVTVRDTGKGIPADALTRIFEPFYTTKEVGKGTGLGLAIAYGIVQEHGGTITAANHPEGGALFTVELPAALPDRRREG